MSENELSRRIKKKIENNIKLVYLNDALGQELLKIRENLSIPKNFYIHFFPKDNKDFLEKFDGVYELIGYLVGKWSENKRSMARDILDKVDDYSSGVDQKLASLSKACKINPILWNEIVMGRIVDIPLNTMIIMAEQFAVHYLPIISAVDGSLIPIHINELTTLEDIKAIWPQILEMQRELELKNNYQNAKREFSQLKRNTRASELRKEGLTYSEIHKQLLSEGFDSPSYDYVSKMLKGYKKAGGRKIIS